ncbi:hypothetical protein ACRRTK_001837 [Alexandromys fortis]
MKKSHYKILSDCMTIFFSTFPPAGIPIPKGTDFQERNTEKLELFQLPSMECYDGQLYLTVIFPCHNWKIKNKNAHQDLEATGGKEHGFSSQKSGH